MISGFRLDLEILLLCDCIPALGSRENIGATFSTKSIEILHELVKRSLPPAR